MRIKSISLSRSVIVKFNQTKEIYIGAVHIFFLIKQLNADMFTNINSVIIVMIEQDKIHYNKNQTRLGSSS